MTATDQPIDGQSQEWEASTDDEFAPPTRRRFPLVTGVLAVLVVAGGAFLAGVQVQKHHDRSLVTTTAAGFAVQSGAPRARVAERTCARSSTTASSTASNRVCKPACAPERLDSPSARSAAARSAVDRASAVSPA